MWLLVPLMHFDLDIHLGLVQAGLVLYFGQACYLITFAFDIECPLIHYHNSFQSVEYGLYPNL